MIGAPLMLEPALSSADGRQRRKRQLDSYEPSLLEAERQQLDRWLAAHRARSWPWLPG
jgi:hypothetical protein